MKWLLLLLLWQQPQEPLTVHIVGGSRTVQFGFVIGKTHPGRVALDAQIELRDPGPVSFIWSVHGPKTGYLVAENTASAQLLVFEPGTYTVQLVASDGHYIKSDFVTVTVLKGKAKK